MKITKVGKLKSSIYLILITLLLISCSTNTNSVSTRYIEYDSQKIEYKVRNSKSDISCFLIHGFGDSYSSFENLFPIFDSINVKTIYYDLPGMGTNKNIKIGFEENLSIINQLYRKEAKNQS